MKSSKKVVVVGLGYVGLPLAMKIAKREYAVSGVDANPKVIDALNSGNSHIEDVDEAELRVLLSSNKISFGSDFKVIRDASVVIICVPTPLNHNYEPDLSFLKRACESIAKNIRENSLVILESTVYPGATKQIVVNDILLHSGLERSSLFFSFSPERIDPGNQKWTLDNVPKIVSGDGERDATIAHEFYSQIFDEVVVTEDTIVAELAKLLENTFRLINIAFINQFALFCNQLNLDVNSIIDLAATKPFGFMPFHPGPGIGGHCIPVDPVYLNKIVRDNGLKISILDEALDSNRDIVTRTIKKIERTLKHESKAGLKIGILGIAYKADISDSRESPAIELIKRARAAGWSVIWNDDLVQEWNGEKSHSIEKILMDSDLVIACTIHSTVNKLRIIQDSQSKILDLTYKMPSSDKVIRL